MISKRIIMLGLLLFCWSPHAHADCEKSIELYHQANQKGIRIDEKIRLLEQSIADCPSFAAYFELGKTHALSGNSEKGIDTLLTACSHTKEKQEKAEAFHAIARIYRSIGKISDAAMYYKLALKSNRTRPLELEFIETMKGQSLVNANDISDTLKKGIRMHKAIGVIGVVPSIDLKVHFEYDSYTLTSEGMAQAKEIGKAMATIPQNFILIGHTDSRGTDEYNDGLSLNRAASVKSFLVKGMNIPEQRITVEGKGKRELIVHGDTEEDHAQNRRVEVRLDMKE